VAVLVPGSPDLLLVEVACSFLALSVPFAPAVPFLWVVPCFFACLSALLGSTEVPGMLGERGLGLVVHIPSGYVAKINIP
jgi:hypothetical protein